MRVPDIGILPGLQRSWNYWTPRLGLLGISPTSGYRTGPKRPALLTSTKHEVLRLWLWTVTQHHLHGCLWLHLSSSCRPPLHTLAGAGREGSHSQQLSTRLSSSHKGGWIGEHMACSAAAISDKSCCPRPPCVGSPPVMGKW